MFQKPGDRGESGKVQCLLPDPGDGGGDQRVAPFLGGESEQGGAGVHNTLPVT